MAEFSITITGHGETLMGAADCSILDTCLSAGLPMPYKCRSGECGECVAALSDGEVFEIPGADPAVFTGADRAAGKILTCICFPRSDLAIDVALRDGIASPLIETVAARVERIERRCADIVEVTLRADAPIDYRAGQYFEWGLPGIAPNRAFSAANRPGSESISFHIRLYPGGKVGEYVGRRLQTGEPVELTGPYGHFGFSANQHRPAICIAGGTGMAPIRAVLDDAFHRRDARSIRYFYGARTQAGLYCMEEMQAWAAEHANFSFTPVLSDEPGGSDWPGERGLVSDAAARLAGDLFGAEAYLCGPPPMIDAAIEVLTALGLTPEDIHTDRFTICS